MWNNRFCEGVSSMKLQIVWGSSEKSMKQTSFSSEYDSSHESCCFFSIFAFFQAILGL